MSAPARRPFQCACRDKPGLHFHGSRHPLTIRSARRSHVGRICLPSTLDPLTLCVPAASTAPCLASPTATGRSAALPRVRLTRSASVARRRKAREPAQEEREGARETAVARFSAAPFSLLRTVAHKRNLTSHTPSRAVKCRSPCAHERAGSKGGAHAALLLLPLPLKSRPRPPWPSPAARPRLSRRHPHDAPHARRRLGEQDGQWPPGRFWCSHCCRNTCRMLLAPSSTVPALASFRFSCAPLPPPTALGFQGASVKSGL